jgi:hypothetical protein
MGDGLRPEVLRRRAPASLDRTHIGPFALCRRARPYSDDPNTCIFESYAIERFPGGRETRTERV